MELVIRAEGLKKYFGELKAVDDVSFQVERVSCSDFWESTGHRFIDNFA